MSPGSVLINMQYGKTVKAKFISRPNRFIAEVEADGAKCRCHVKNTGRCKELLVPGCTVYLEDFEGRMGSRRMRYSLIAAEKETGAEKLLINMDSQAPNKVTEEALKDGTVRFPGLGKLKVIRPETTFGNSRFDFYLEDEDGKKAYLEVKGCTLENEGIASFPDAPTERGVKHIEELIRAKEQGFGAGILFVIQMEGVHYMVPNDETHLAFGNALRQALKAGVAVMGCWCAVAPDSLKIQGPLEIRC